MTRTKMDQDYCNQLIYAYVMLNQKDIKNKDEIIGICRKLPTFVRKSGAVTAISYLKSKSKKEGESNNYLILYNGIDGWFSNNKRKKENKDLSEWIFKLGLNRFSNEFQIVSKELETLAISLKRVAEDMKENN